MDIWVVLTFQHVARSGWMFLSTASFCWHQRWGSFLWVCWLGWELAIGSIGRVGDLGPLCFTDVNFALSHCHESTHTGTAGLPGNLAMRMRWEASLRAGGGMHLEMGTRLQQDLTLLQPVDWPSSSGQFNYFFPNNVTYPDAYIIYKWALIQW